MGDYAAASGWRHQARLSLADHHIEAVSPVYAPWEGDAPPALTPEAVEWPDLQELERCRYIIVAGGAGSGTGFGLGYAFARHRQGAPGPETLIWVLDAGSPPPFIRLWNPVCVASVNAAVEWIVQKETASDASRPAAGSASAGSSTAGSAAESQEEFAGGSAADSAAARPPQGS
ncbi:MAG: hypothetical protein LC772_07510 [Chloroflexi bacterium]|nr:hypothetical protein [Chloroflexota bacterium]